MPTSAATVQPAPAPQLLLDHQLCFSLYAASLAMTRRYQPLLTELGLTYPQYIALLALWEHDDVTVSALGDRLALDSGTLTPLLKRMEASGWVTRERDAADERRVRVRLTLAGRALRERAQHIPTSLLAGSGVTATQVRQLTAELQALRQRLAG